MNTISWQELEIPTEVNGERTYQTVFGLVMGELVVSNIGQSEANVGYRLGWSVTHLKSGYALSTQLTFEQAVSLCRIAVAIDMDKVSEDAFTKSKDDYSADSRLLIALIKQLRKLKYRMNESTLTEIYAWMID